VAQVKAGSTGGYAVRVQIDGVANTVRALRTLAPDLSRRMRAKLRAAGGRIARFADAKAPDNAKGGYKVRIRTKSRDRFAVSVLAISKNAAIFEFAANAKTAQGAALIARLSKFGSPGRFLWDAWDALGGQVQDEMRMTIAEAERALQARIDAGTGRGQLV
jgi:hypothetical protein